MNSRDRHSKDQLDILIRQALLESVANEEPPAHVWARIRNELTKPERQTTLFWSRPVLQTALLFMILVVSGTLVGPDWLVQPSSTILTPTSSEVQPTLPVERTQSLSRSPSTTPGRQYQRDSGLVALSGANDTLDEDVFLQGMRSTLVEDTTSQPGAPQATTSISSDTDTWPDPASVEAKVVFFASSPEPEPAGNALEPTDGGIWPNLSIWQ